MAKCNKCGGKTSKRRAGVFSCNHCGVQPGQANMDRGGIPAPVQEYTTTSTEPYIIGTLWTPPLRAKGNTRNLTV